MPDEKIVAQDALIIDEDGPLKPAKGEYQDGPGEAPEPAAVEPEEKP
jgi:hypothetical protein